MTDAPNPATPSGLAPFIRANVEPILAEWETFARSLPVAEGMDIAALRDHAKEMLNVIADDLESPQTMQQQRDKAHGSSDVAPEDAATAAQEHGAGRADSGFTVGQMVAEFRALRASVMRLWCKSMQKAGALELSDMTRFNEAIDQAIAESISRYTHQIGQTKERFLAILGHDLRSPVGAIVTSTQFMLDTAAESGDLGKPYHGLLEGISRSARRMNQMVADLLEFARISFGDTFPVQRVPMDIGQLVRDAVAEINASYPRREINMEVDGDLRGEWDTDRLFQMLTNLLGNAVQHGAPQAAIHVAARGEADAVRITVGNTGPTIDPDTLARMSRGMTSVAPAQERDRRHLGLGLYIVQRIVAAHDGTLEVRSSDTEGTTFTVRLPRVPDTA